MCVSLESTIHRTTFFQLLPGVSITQKIAYGTHFQIPYAIYRTHLSQILSGNCVHMYAVLKFLARPLGLAFLAESEYLLLFSRDDKYLLLPREEEAFLPTSNLFRYYPDRCKCSVFA